MGETYCSQGNYQLEHSTAYSPLRPTKLDKIKNFHIEIQASSLTCTLG